MRGAPGEQQSCPGRRFVDGADRVVRLLCVVTQDRDGAGDLAACFGDGLADLADDERGEFVARLLDALGSRVQGGGTARGAALGPEAGGGTGALDRGEHTLASGGGRFGQDVGGAGGVVADDEGHVVRSWDPWGLEDESGRERVGGV